MKRIALKLIAAVTVAAVLLLSWLVWFAVTPLDLRVSPLDFNVKPGTSLRGVSRQLSEAGAGFSPWQFTVLARLLGESATLRAGSYTAQSGITPYQLLRKLAMGEVSQAEIVFVEGMTFRQIRKIVDAHPLLRHDTSGLPEPELMQLLGADQFAAEGLFYPDKYLFDRDSSDIELLRRANQAMGRVLADEWEKRAPDVPYANAYQALIVASLVEKETGLASDRENVAGVFVNRLRAGMLLQTDPSVIYGLGARFDGNLRKRDLQSDTPYNTYTRPGLPPTPIAMPGLASIQAALHPAQTDHLYFVARGDGSSEFSRSLDQHNRAVNRYQRNRN